MCHFLEENLSAKFVWHNIWTLIYKDHHNDNALLWENNTVVSEIVYLKEVHVNHVHCSKQTSEQNDHTCNCTVVDDKRYSSVLSL